MPENQQACEKHRKEKRREEKKRKEKKRKEKKRKEKKRKEKKRKEKKRKDYAFRRQFNEKPSIIPSCPGCEKHTTVKLMSFCLMMP